MTEHTTSSTSRLSETDIAYRCVLYVVSCLVFVIGLAVWGQVEPHIPFWDWRTWSLFGPWIAWSLVYLGSLWRRAHA